MENITTSRSGAGYHFALLPRMIKQARPDARSAIFWHIPWPNRSLRYLSWQRELVDGCWARICSDFTSGALHEFSSDGRPNGITYRLGTLSVAPRSSHYSADRSPSASNSTRTRARPESAYEERASLLKALGVEAATWVWASTA
jgi:trehalose 6-phosphate synthase